MDSSDDSAIRVAQPAAPIARRRAVMAALASQVVEATDGLSEREAATPKLRFAETAARWGRFPLRWFAWNRGQPSRGTSLVKIGIYFGTFILSAFACFLACTIRSQAVFRTITSFHHSMHSRLICVVYMAALLLWFCCKRLFGLGRPTVRRECAPGYRPRRL